MTTYTLDVRRLLCPMPVIKTQQKVKTLAAGDHLIVTATDPGTLQDIPSWCRIFGHTVIDSRQVKDDIIIEILIARN